ncbi:MAG: Gfo/Idh/MocA family oxidoreductase [Chloroflexi bacterium]|nr:Gfo/Idh/MocA family oxidoreductase [Chloroflexota bacterium]
MAAHGVLLIGGNRTHLEGYARGFATDPRCRVVAVADESGLPDYRSGLNRLLASELGVPYIDGLDAALRRDDIDVVCMCADVERRGRVATRCAEAGKHIYLDKPLAGSVEDARRIADAVEKASVLAQMFSNINGPWEQRARKAVREGAVGDLLGVHSDMLMAKGRPGTAPYTGRRRKEAPSPDRWTFVEAKRELLDMGVYSVSTALWLAGARASSVYATTANYFFAEHARLDIEDFGTITMELENGTVATATGGRIGWTSHPRAGLRRVVLAGTRGALTFTDSDPHVKVFSDEPPFEMPPVHPWDPMAMWSSTQREVRPRPKNQWLPIEEFTQEADIRAFLDCLDRRSEPEMNARVSVHHIEVIMAAYRSAASGKPVTIG